MKIGIVGAGNVGYACAMAATIRGSAREIVLINRTRKRAEAMSLQGGVVRASHHRRSSWDLQHSAKSCRAPM